MRGAQALAEEAEIIGAHRVFLVCGHTLNTQTDEIERVRKALGTKLVGVFDAGNTWFLSGNCQNGNRRVSYELHRSGDRITGTIREEEQRVRGGFDVLERLVINASR